jgi:hypothetical protein
MFYTLYLISCGGPRDKQNQSMYVHSLHKISQKCTTFQNLLHLTGTLIMPLSVVCEGNVRQNVDLIMHSKHYFISLLSAIICMNARIGAESHQAP